MKFKIQKSRHGGQAKFKIFILFTLIFVFVGGLFIESIRVDVSAQSGDVNNYICADGRTDVETDPMSGQFVCCPTGYNYRGDLSIPKCEALDPNDPTRGYVQVDPELAVLKTQFSTPDLGVDEPRYIDGRSCVQAYADCPTGYVNLQQSVANGTTNLEGLSKNDLNESLLGSFTGGSDSVSDLNNICIREDLSQNITRRIGFTEGETGGMKFSDSGIPVACPSGWEIQQGPHDVDFANAGPLTVEGKPYGCCPSTHKFVNQTVDYQRLLSTEGADIIQLGVCCLENNPVGDPNRAKLREDNSNKGCYTQDERLIYSFNDAQTWHATNIGNQTFASEKEYFDKLAESPIIYEVFSDPYPSIGKGTNPQYGIAIGPKFLGSSETSSSRVYINNSATNSLATCGPNTSCAVVPLSQLDGMDIDTGEIGIIDENFVVVRPSVLENNPGITCQRCFTNDEFISLGDNDTALICSSGNPIVIEEARNGRTISEMKALRIMNPENQEVAGRCIDQGGIYVAIGCIDPTPIGIMTGLIRIALGVVGGVALVQLILAGIAYQGGNEEQIKKAQSRIFATIGGLAVLIFSVLILRIIGVNILDVVPDGIF